MLLLGCPAWLGKHYVVLEVVVFGRRRYGAQV